MALQVLAYVSSHSTWSLSTKPFVMKPLTSALSSSSPLSASHTRSWWCSLFTHLEISYISEESRAVLQTLATSTFRIISHLICLNLGHPLPTTHLPNSYSTILFVCLPWMSLPCRFKSQVPSPIIQGHYCLAPAHFSAWSLLVTPSHQASFWLNHLPFLTSFQCVLTPAVRQLLKWMHWLKAEKNKFGPLLWVSLCNLGYLTFLSLSFCTWEMDLILFDPSIMKKSVHHIVYIEGVLGYFH